MSSFIAWFGRNPTHDNLSPPGRHARRLRGAVAAGLACAAFGCGKAEREKRAADLLAVSAESSTAATVAARPQSPLWDVDRASEKLVRAGVAPRRIDPPPSTPAFFSTATAAGAFHVGRGGEVRIFIFADSVARRKAAGELDPFTASPRGETMAWPEAPVLIVVQNLVAIMLGGNAALKERVQLALEVGLPAQ